MTIDFGGPNLTRPLNEITILHRPAGSVIGVTEGPKTPFRDWQATVQFPPLATRIRLSRLSTCALIQPPVL